MTKVHQLLLLVILLVSCQERNTPVDLNDLLADTPGKQSTAEYLNSPYVTAGDKCYLVGHQNGTFPPHGWHVAGEMGGLWDHPIKLLDGFQISVESNDMVWKLTDATTFFNHAAGNRLIFEHATLGLGAQLLQFIPDGNEGLILELSVTNQSNADFKGEIELQAFVDLMPVWLSERLGIENGEDLVSWDPDGFFVAKDQNNPWFVLIGSDQENISPLSSMEGPIATLRQSCSLEPGKSTIARYYIAGSYRSKAQALATYQKLRENPVNQLQRKIQRLENVVNTAKVDLPDKVLQDMYDWTKINTDWLIREVDTIGRGLSAGMADYPWWFGADNCYSLQGLLSTGRHDEVFSTVALLAKLSNQSEGPYGQIIHEASTNGVVFNPGNLNETPHFVYLLWEIYKWTGDLEFLKTYYPLAQAGMDWILAQDHDGNLYADGPGMMEIPGLHTEMVDVVVYTQMGALALSRMAQELEESSVASKYGKIAEDLRERINTEWWAPDAGSFADFRADKHKTLELIDAAIVRSDTINKPWAVEELRDTRAKVASQNAGVRSQVVYHNWVVNTPMEMGLADRDKAIEALATARAYRSTYGSYVTGLDRDESKGESTKWEVFSYVGAVMTLPTGVQAIAENNYGNPDEAYEYLKRLTNSFSYALPGSTYEVSPDYGMMAQAWNIYALAVPIVNQFFGFSPQAHRETLFLTPNMPSSWSNASISDVLAGNNRFSLSKETANGKTTYRITQTGNWKINFLVPGTQDTITFDGKEQVITRN